VYGSGLTEAVTEHQVRSVMGRSNRSIARRFRAIRPCRVSPGGSSPARPSCVSTY
jgi:hypothetical protein